MGLEVGMKNIMLDKIDDEANRIWLSDSTPQNPVSDIKDIDTSGWSGFNAASGGSLVLTSAIVFNVSAGNTVENIVVANSASSELVIIPVTNETFTNAGTYTLNSLTITLS